MKVALAVPNFPPEFVGGTERVTAALANALRAHGCEPLIVSGSDQAFRGETVERERWQGLSVLRLRRTPEEEYGIDVERPRLREAWTAILRAEGVDAVHLHHWATLSNGLVRAARRLGLPVVVTLHDMWVTCPRFFRRPPAGVRCPDGGGRGECVPCAALNITRRSHEWLGSEIVRRDAELRAELEAADVICAPSRACRDRIRAHLPWPDAPIEVVPHGLLEPVGEHAPEAPRDGVLRVGTFGNLCEEKGVALLVHELQGIGGVELHLFGPFLEPGFEALIRERAANGGVVLHCHGPYGRDDPHPARKLDVAVFPSLCEETYGLVVEEALARGVPVVVSHLGALSERIGGGGIVVDVAELGPLHGCLAQLAADRTILDRLRAGIPAEFLTIDDAARRYADLYRMAQEQSA